MEFDECFLKVNNNLRIKRERRFLVQELCYGNKVTAREISVIKLLFDKLLLRHKESICVL